VPVISDTTFLLPLSLPPSSKTLRPLGPCREYRRDVEEEERANGKGGGGENDIQSREKITKIITGRKTERGRGGEENEWIKMMREDVKREMREGMREIKEIIKEQGKEIRGEIEKMKKQLKQGEENWRKEKETMGKRIMELEKKIESWQIGEKNGREKEGGQEKVGERIRELERKIEKKEREDRRRNIVVRGIKGGKKEVEREIKKIMRELGLEVDTENMRSIEGKGKEVNLTIVRLQNIGQKKRVMEGRRGVKGRNIRIEDDLTWKDGE